MASLLTGFSQFAGIIFNSRVGKQVFSEPTVFPIWFPVLGGAGVYCILVPDNTWGPRQFRPIYFGETSNFATRITAAHEHYPDWQREAGQNQLYVCQHWMTGTAESERRSLEATLIDWYRPACNQTLSPFMPNLALAALWGTHRPTTLQNLMSVGTPMLTPPPPVRTSLLPIPLRETKPAPVRVFTSFDFDHDDGLRTLLVGQGKNPDTPFEIHDWSVKEPFTGDWKRKVRQKISRVAQVIVLCGEHTDTATGVNAELKIAQELDKPYFLLAGYRDKICKKPKAASADDKVYKWTWDNLKKADSRSSLMRS